MDVKPIIEEIRAEMDRRLLTQSEVARMAGISRQRVNGVIRGYYSALATVRAIRDALWPEVEGNSASR